MLLVISSCSDRGMEVYSYQNDFQDYLKAIEADLQNDEVLLLPLDSCGLCVDQVLEDLEKTEKLISVILSGNQVAKDRLDKAKKLLQKKNLQLIIDENSRSKSYDLNAFSPIIIDVSKKEYRYVSLSPKNSAEFILD
ncbi:MAG: hypothetical protein P8O16_10645 [Algoriphagus sp.]|uniref:hypothetical protein n=1 Tax=Algoriphagus sp. TaxID=1872435 RepID=UPI002608D6F1|nr:hypothetical protein [Algoriphagus sp.]MDG1277731.1 hypothetical protein [Algoriphagus sp.]